jgi:hypothetical protein
VLLLVRQVSWNSKQRHQGVRQYHIKTVQQQLPLLGHAGSASYKWESTGNELELTDIHIQLPELNNTAVRGLLVAAFKQPVVSQQRIQYIF